MISDVEAMGYIAVMAAVTYAIRALPLTLIQREIKSPRIRAFLRFVPYVTLSVMTLPAILDAGTSSWAGWAACAAAVALAWMGQDMFRVSLAAVAAAFIAEMIAGM